MDSRAFQEELDGLEKGLDRLRAKYELYFQGIERIEPQRDREAIERGMRRLLREVPNNTSLRFRFNTFKQKLITLKTYWGRISRQIEEGTYRRHVKRAKKRFGLDAQGPQDDKPKKQVFELDMDADGDIDLDALFGNLTRTDDAKPAASRMTRQRTPGALPSVPQRPSRAPASSQAHESPARPVNLAQSARKVGASLPPKRPAPPPATAQTGKQVAAKTAASVRKPASAARPTGANGEERYRQVFDRYLEERKKNNQRVDHLRYEAVAGKLKKMMPQLEEKHKGKKIDFEVVVQGGKVGIKPVAK